MKYSTFMYIYQDLNCIETNSTKGKNVDINLRLQNCIICCDLAIFDVYYSLEAY